ncbi:MAG: glycosyltransferase family 4 protein [Thermoplasmata archaeon]
MRILQVSAFPSSEAGGSQTYSHELSRRLARRHEVHLLTSRLNTLTGQRRTRNGLHIHEAPSPATLFHTPLTVALPYLLQEAFDLLHVHSYVFLTSTQSALAARLRKIPFLLHLHGGLEPATPDSPSPVKGLYLRKRLFDLTAGRLTVRAAQAIASVSRRDIRLASQLFDLDLEVFHWIPNAVNSSLLKRGWKGENLERMTYVGRLEPWKGTIDLLKISRALLKRRPNVEILVAGKGSMTGDVQREAAKSDGRMCYLGQVQPNQIPRLLEESTLLILPSYIEGVPTVALEAMAVGTPTVLSRVGGTPEIVKHGVTGFLFEVGDSRGCVELVDGLLDDRSSLRSVTSKAKKVVEKWHTWERVVLKVESLYKALSELRK